ncbi:MAG: hypothetical protein JW929_09130 [Anaerolineales bacterium]|nr:hypothetical protein [Anaerolineales bacterium]
MDSVRPLRKPARLTAIAVMTLISGLLNLFWSLPLFLVLSAFGILTFPFGCICIPLGFCPLILGSLEILYAAKLLRNPISPKVRPAYHIAVLEILGALFGNVFALIAGIASLIFYNDREVRRAFGET